MRSFVALIVATAAAAAADLPSGEELLQRCIERSGGAQLLAQVKGVEMKGTVEMIGRNLTGSILIDEQGEKSYSAIEFPGVGRIEEGYNGDVAWELSAIQGARIKEGDEKAAIERSSSFRVLTRWKEYYSSVSNVGPADVNGKPAWKVEMTPKQGKPETFYFDRDSGLLVRMVQTVPTPLGEIPTEIGFGDYRPVEGIQTPFAISQKVMSQEIAIKIGSATYKADIPPSRFDLPAPVRELVEKKKAEAR